MEHVEQFVTLKDFWGFERKCKRCGKVFQFKGPEKNRMSYEDFQKLVGRPIEYFPCDFCKAITPQELIAVEIKPKIEIPVIK